MAHIAASDITDDVVARFDLTEYLALAETELADLAEQRGVGSGDISDPLHYKVKQWLVAWVCMRVCLDKIGVNNTDVPAEIEKYTVKYKLYLKREASLRTEISISMLVDQVDEMRDRANPNHGWLFRG